MSRESFHLSLKDTNVLKGLALLMLLAHHLFYRQYGLYDDIQITNNHCLVQDIGIWCKLCVAIFVFLSGYGLTVGAINSNGINNLKKLYLYPFTKLLMNYWLIWILFVPLSVFVFGRSFTDAYQTNIALKFILDLFGVINCFGWYGYNVTWWFYACIIVLYLSYPFLYRLMNKSVLMLLVVSFILYYLPGPFFHGSNIYYASFIYGMLLCKYEKAIKITPLWWILIFIFLAVERLYPTDGIHIFDAVLTISLVLAYKSITLPSIIHRFLEFAGKHSMNIFLFHTFIYYYWFRDFIYSSRNPIIIYLLLLFICLTVSILIELIKKTVCFDKLCNKIVQKNLQL